MGDCRLSYKGRALHTHAYHVWQRQVGKVVRQQHSETTWGTQVNNI
jgi:hypothetical protein